MITHRLCRERYAKSSLRGEGARLYGGRWNPRGERLVYTSSSLPLAALEAFVHFSSSILPRDYVHVAIEIPDSLEVETWIASSLPADWASTPPPSALAELGRQWIVAARAAVLRVPSAVVNEDLNVLINPAHPDAAKITIQKMKAFSFDPRLSKSSP